ncbi:MAG: hypothetical protein HYW85_00085 [Deltaproteobacteria bacterium]|nr:hypothetical protein [Deltaproteobacteria bacterium]
MKRSLFYVSILCLGIVLTNIQCGPKGGNEGGSTGNAPQSGTTGNTGGNQVGALPVGNPIVTPTPIQPPPTPTTPAPTGDFIAGSGAFSGFGTYRNGVWLQTISAPQVNDEIFVLFSGVHSDVNKLTVEFAIYPYVSSGSLFPFCDATPPSGLNPLQTSSTTLSAAYNGLKQNDSTQCLGSSSCYIYSTYPNASNWADPTITEPPKFKIGEAARGQNICVYVTASDGAGHSRTDKKYFHIAQ